MDRSLRLIVCRSDAIFDDVIARPQCVFRYDQMDRGDRRVGQRAEKNEDTREKYAVDPICLCTRGLISCLVSAYIATLSNSCVYRKSALEVLFQWVHVSPLDKKPVVFIRLKTPRRQFLDYKWNERMTRMVMERQEADHAMSWLSTLGGAFSALGEEFERCAEMAGKISVRQFELAIRLGDPLLVARCRLYSALSLVQRGYFRTPRYMIRRIYTFAIEEKDVRLQNMCQGMWAKLQYCYKQYKQQRRSASSKILHIS